MLSFGMLAARAARSTLRRRGFPSGSPPPSRAATVISFRSLVKTRPRFASAAAFLCLIVCHFECPDMRPSPGAKPPVILAWRDNKQEARGLGRGLPIESRRCPTLPRRCQRSTIGAGGLNFRVRNGNGCDPSAMVAGKPYETAANYTRTWLESELETGTQGKAAHPDPAALDHIGVGGIVGRCVLEIRAMADPVCPAVCVRKAGLAHISTG